MRNININPNAPQNVQDRAKQEIAEGRIKVMVQVQN